MKQYQALLERILLNGQEKEDRTGTGTISVFGEQITIPLFDTFPIITTKKIHFKSVVHELLWMISGNTNIKYLKDNGVTIWNEWADEKGNLGPVYGSQWRYWKSSKIETHKMSNIGYPPDIFAVQPRIDQLKQVINDIRTNPDSRRLIVSAWNPSEVPDMKLPPCHMMFQFYVNNGQLSCHMYQRSADAFLGVPFNISQYALLTRMIAHITNLTCHKLVISFGDLHIYKNHIDQVNELLKRTPLEKPKLLLNHAVKEIDQFKYEDIILENYKYLPKIPAPVAI